MSAAKLTPTDNRGTSTGSVSPPEATQVPPRAAPRGGIFTEIVRLQRAGGKAVLATPLWHIGSVPLAAESKLLLRDDGTMLGTVGGGLLEARVTRVAQHVLATGESQTLEFELTQDQAARSGMICGGRCAVLVEPIGPGRDAAVYAAVAQAVESNQPVVVLTVLPPEGGSTKIALLSEGRTVGDPQRVARALACAGQAEACPTLPEAVHAIAKDVLKAGRPRFIEEPVRAHFDPIVPRPTVFVFGAGHVAIPVAQTAALVGFRVVVIDDRAEFANRERFPSADEVIVASVSDAFNSIGVGETGYVVTITRGHAMDEEVVAHALHTPARYIGMIGSKRKVAGVLGRLRARGFSEADLARVHAPIGVDINAETVEEIAVSIVAELIAVRRREDA